MPGIARSHVSRPRDGLQVWESAFRDHVTALEGLAEDDMVRHPGGLKPGAGGEGRAPTSARLRFPPKKEQTVHASRN